MACLDNLPLFNKVNLTDERSLQMDLELEGKKILITGGGSGIGLETAQLLNQEGANVILLDKNTGKIDSNTFATPQNVVSYQCDVTRPENLQDIHQKLVTQDRKVDILIHCAGITGAQGDFSDISLGQWHDVFDVNLFGAVNTTKEFLSDFENNGWGRIIFIASEDGQQPYSDEIPYCCTKAGVLALSKGLSRTLGRKNILVNTVSPAFINTPMTDRMMEKRADQLGISFDEAIRSFLNDKRPYMTSQRRGKVAEVANVIAFLCSEKASFINGSEYRVDAGSVATI